MGSEDREALASGANAFIYKGSGLGSLREAMAVALSKANDKPRRAL
jgi:L-asparaginase/Glu-tRNA(Gln) amidotransferase subunit D